MICVNTTVELMRAIEYANSTKDKTAIQLQSGNYEINSTIRLSDNIELLGTENVNLFGTKRISIRNASIENGIYKISLSDEGITDSGHFGLGPYVDFWEEYDIPKPHMDDLGPSLELYYGEKKMNISRYPENGFIKIKQAVGDTLLIERNERCGSK